MLPKDYLSSENLLTKLHNESEKYWINKGEKRALQLFKEMSVRVPAYRDFLKINKVDPSKIASIKDFENIPTLNKDNYLRKYPKEKLCWDGNFAKGQWVISSTSGSTGQPYYFPRESSQDWQYAITAELYLRNNFQIHKKRSLYIVAFPMGAWIGGLFTYEALKLLSQKGNYDLSIITPGIHKQEVINAVKQLGGHFDQIIIGSYAPFLKDILDDGKRAGIKWEELNVKFIFSAEAFTEKFRDYVLKMTNNDDPITSTLNHYGTVDLGTMAHETPESILIRRTLVENDQLEFLFPEPYRQPTLAQYNPELFYFEAQGNNLICSAYSGIPLFRYDLSDYGGILTRGQLHSRLIDYGYNVDSILKSITDRQLTWNLPFVFVYERNDFSVSYYAFQLYPDTIRRGLQDDNLETYLTGKFSMEVNYSESGRQQLNIYIELRHAIVPTKTIENEVLEGIQRKLMDESSEYREVYKMVGPEALPKIVLLEYEDEKYFKPGTKQKWVIK